VHPSPPFSSIFVVSFSFLPDWFSFFSPVQTRARWTPPPPSSNFDAESSSISPSNPPSRRLRLKTPSLSCGFSVIAGSYFVAYARRFPTPFRPIPLPRLLFLFFSSLPVVFLNDAKHQRPSSSFRCDAASRFSSMFKVRFSRPFPPSSHARFRVSPGPSGLPTFSVPVSVIKRAPRLIVPPGADQSAFFLSFSYIFPNRFVRTIIHTVARLPPSFFEKQSLV